MQLKITTLAVVLSTVISMSAAQTPAYAGEAAKSAAASESARVPATAPEIWEAVDKEMTAMQKLIDAGTIEELHHHAFAVRDLVAALPGHSASPAPGKPEEVKADGKFVATLASRLDAAGDSNDKEAASANFAKLQSLLKLMRENYPETTK